MGIKSLGNVNVRYKSVWDKTGYGAALQWEPPGWYGERACFGGGYNGSSDLNEIDYVAIMTIGNASDFGDLTQSRQYIAGVSNGTLGLFMGGGNASGTPYAITDYITVATTGNATDFGDPTTNRTGAGGVSDGTYAIMGGGAAASPGWPNNGTDIIDYYTIETPGNATDFGDLNTVVQDITAVNDATRGCFLGGNANGDCRVNVIDYITMATPGNATDFGDLTNATAIAAGGVDNSSRGVMSGGTEDGTGVTNKMEYITIATTGNATDFGDNTQARFGFGGCNNQTRGIWGGGKRSSGATDRMDYATIATASGATDFADLTQVKQGTSACAGA